MMHMIRKGQVRWLPKKDVVGQVRGGLHADKGVSRFGLWAVSLEVVAQDRGTARVAERP